MEINPNSGTQPKPSRTIVIAGFVLVFLALAGGAYYIAGESSEDGYGDDVSWLSALNEDDEESLQTATNSCPLPVTEKPEQAIAYGVPSGWVVESDGDTLAIMEDASNTTAAFIYTAKLERDLSAAEFLSDFGAVFQTIIEEAGGSFTLSEPSGTEQTATANAEATVEEGRLAGVFSAHKEPGFVTFKAYWAPTEQLALKEPTLKEVVGCFVRSTSLTDSQLAAATAARTSGISSTGAVSEANNPWGALMAQSKGGFSFQAPSSWTANTSGGASTTSLTLDAPTSDASVAFISDLGRYGAVDPAEFAQTTLSILGVQASLDGAQEVSGAQSYEFSGSFQGKPVAGAITVKIEPYSTFFAHYAGIQLANADKWTEYAPTLNAMQASIRQGDASQALGSLPALPNYSTENLFGSTSSGSSVTSSSRYQDEVSDRSSQKWADAMRGYEEVESPTTGQRYDAPLNSWNPSGPDGAGYYRQLPGGGGLEKLNPSTP